MEVMACLTLEASVEQLADQAVAAARLALVLDDVVAWLADDTFVEFCLALQAEWLELACSAG